MLATMIWSCDQSQGVNQQKINTYYDIEGLIEEQLLWLDSVSPFLYKSGTIDGQKNAETVQPTDSVWRQEFLVFRSMDINKPILADSYNISEEETATGFTSIYISKFPRATLVDSLRIDFDQNKNPLFISAFQHSQNPLFVSQKRLEMYFDVVGAHSILSAFRISGMQKMITRKRVSFDIDSKLNIH